MTAVGFTTAQESDCWVHGGIAKAKVKPLLAVSADSRDSVERIRQTPSGGSARRSFADEVGLMIGVVNGVSQYYTSRSRPRFRMHARAAIRDEFSTPGFDSVLQ